jgi:hypothetical protein
MEGVRDCQPRWGTQEDARGRLALREAGCYRGSHAVWVPWALRRTPGPGGTGERRGRTGRRGPRGQSRAWTSWASGPVACQTRGPGGFVEHASTLQRTIRLTGKWRGPTLRAGPLVSRPVSRILSWTAIHLCGRPGPWRVTCKRSCLALHRVGFAQPPRHRDAGALLPHHFTLACAELSSGSAIGGVFLWHFPAGFPGSVSPTTLPCGVRTFLDGLSVPPRLPSLHWRG